MLSPITLTAFQGGSLGGGAEEVLERRTNGQQVWGQPFFHLTTASRWPFLSSFPGLGGEVEDGVGKGVRR